MIIVYILLVVIVFVIIFIGLYVGVQIARVYDSISRINSENKGQNAHLSKLEESIQNMHLTDANLHRLNHDVKINVKDVQNIIASGSQKIEQALDTLDKRLTHEEAKTSYAIDSMKNFIMSSKQQLNDSSYTYDSTFTKVYDEINELNERDSKLNQLALQNVSNYYGLSNVVSLTVSNMMNDINALKTDTNKEIDKLSTNNNFAYDQLKSYIGKTIGANGTLYATNKFCIDNTCITKAQLENMLQDGETLKKVQSDMSQNISKLNDILTQHSTTLSRVQSEMELNTAKLQSELKLNAENDAKLQSELQLNAQNDVKRIDEFTRLNQTLAAKLNSWYTPGLTFTIYPGYFGIQGSQIQWDKTSSQEIIGNIASNGTIATGVTTSLNDLNKATNGNILTTNIPFVTIIWRGYFRASSSGPWRFFLTSDDASYLWIGQDALADVPDKTKAVVNNGGIHATVERSGTFNMEQGKFYPIVIIYGNGIGGGSFQFSFIPPELSVRQTDGNTLMFTLVNMNETSSALPDAFTVPKTLANWYTPEISKPHALWSETKVTNTASMSVTFWIRITNTFNTWLNIFHVTNGDDKWRRPAVFIAPNSYGLRWSNSTTSSWDDAQDSPQLTQNKIAHVAMTLKGRTRQVYYDGVLVGTYTLQGDPLQNDSAAKILSSSYPWNSGGFQIKLLQFYPEVLNTSQIKSIMNAQLSLVSHEFVGCYDHENDFADKIYGGWLHLEAAMIEARKNNKQYVALARTSNGSSYGFIFNKLQGSAATGIRSNICKIACVDPKSTQNNITFTTDFCGCGDNLDGTNCGGTARSWAVYQLKY